MTPEGGKKDALGSVLPLSCVRKSGSLCSSRPGSPGDLTAVILLPQVGKLRHREAAWAPRGVRSAEHQSWDTAPGLPPHRERRLVRRSSGATPPPARPVFPPPKCTAAGPRTLTASCREGGGGTAVYNPEGQCSVF